MAVNMKLGKFPDITINNPVMIADQGVVHFLPRVEYMLLLHAQRGRRQDLRRSC